MPARRAAGEGTFDRRPDGRWRARLSVGPRGETLRFIAYGRTRQEAADKLVAKVAAHQHHATVGDPATWTVDQLLDWWTGTYLPGKVADRRIVDTTAVNYARHVRLHLKDRACFSFLPFIEVRTHHIVALHDELRLAGASLSLRRNVHTVLGMVFSAAVRMEWMPSNPVSRVDPPHVERQRRQGITIELARRLWQAAEGDRLEAYWRLLLSAPMRPGEPLGARWPDINVQGRLYILERNLVRTGGQWVFHDTKGHQGRKVPLPSPMMDSLRRHRTRQAEAKLAAGPLWHDPEILDVDGTLRSVDDLVFRTAWGGPWNRRDIGKACDRLCERAGVAPKLTPHGLRHAATTLLREMGVDLAVLQQLAGWTSESMADHYTGTLDAAMRVAVERLAEQLAQ
jgi:integrase